MGRVESEALSAIQEALEGRKFTGDFVSSRFNDDDVNIYCIVEDSNGKMVDKVLAIVWTETQAGATSMYVDINPVDDYEHMQACRKVVEDLLTASGFVMALEVKQVWCSWRKEIVAMVRKNG